jgi:hypothetical protein
LLASLGRSGMSLIEIQLEGSLGEMQIIVPPREYLIPLPSIGSKQSVELIDVARQFRHPSPDSLRRQERTLVKWQEF